ncbi:MAG: glycosyltransferase family 4 protein [Thermosynechococcaceae cyanobacterium MS004]|nr:glycosyltransferase family 4 protein [Thermosynechococcaceae cyanobacterium MS004]
MRILYVNPVGEIGGAERVLLTIFATLKQIQPTIELHLLLFSNGPLADQSAALGVQVLVLSLPERLNQSGDSIFKQNRKLLGISRLFGDLTLSLPRLVKYLMVLRQTIHQIAPDLIHSNGIKPHLLLSLIQPRSTPIVWHIHDFYSSRPLVAKLLRWASIRATAGIAISQAVAADTQKCLPHLPLSVIYNSINIHHFTPSESKVLSTSHPTRIGLVATFARWKGHKVFLDAAAQILQTQLHPSVHFYIIGGPIYKTQGSQYSEAELHQYATQLKISEHLNFLGFQENIADIYRWLDIVVHASTEPEPFGLSIIEAMACGKPVIVAKAGGALELFTHGIDAIGVPPGDPPALAKALENLLSHPELCLKMGDQARHTVTKRFNQEHYGEQILSFYARHHSHQSEISKANL